MCFGPGFVRTPPEEAAVGFRGKMADTFLFENKFLSLEERLRAENEQASANRPCAVGDRMTLDLNTDPPFIRQGSGRRPGPRKLQARPPALSAPAPSLFSVPNLLPGHPLDCDPWFCLSFHLTYFPCTLPAMGRDGM